MTEMITAGEYAIKNNGRQRPLPKLEMAVAKSHADFERILNILDAQHAQHVQYEKKQEDKEDKYEIFFSLS